MRLLHEKKIIFLQLVHEHLQTVETIVDEPCGVRPNVIHVDARDARDQKALDRLFFFQTNAFRGRESDRGREARTGQLVAICPHPP